MRPLLFFSLLLVSCQSCKILHQKAIVADTHNDVLSSATLKGLNIEEDLSGKTHSDLARFRKGGVDVQVFSIFCDETFAGEATAKATSAKFSAKTFSACLPPTPATDAFTFAALLYF